MIFIEKPFFQKPISTREKNEKFYKRSLMVTLIKGTNRVKLKSSFGDEEPKRREMPIASVENDYNLINELDSFGFIEKDLTTLNLKQNKISNIRSDEITHEIPLKRQHDESIENNEKDNQNPKCDKKRLRIDEEFDKEEVDKEVLMSNKNKSLSNHTDDEEEKPLIIDREENEELEGPLSPDRTANNQAIVKDNDITGPLEPDEQSVDSSCKCI
jgi:hypothetical protein